MSKEETTSFTEFWIHKFPLKFYPTYTGSAEYFLYLLYLEAKKDPEAFVQTENSYRNPFVDEAYKLYEIDAGEKWGLTGFQVSWAYGNVKGIIREELENNAY